jgi:hypothetical protein
LRDDLRDEAGADFGATCNTVLPSPANVDAAMISKKRYPLIAAAAVGSHLGVRIWNFGPKKPSNWFCLNCCAGRYKGNMRVEKFWPSPAIHRSFESF